MRTFPVRFLLAMALVAAIVVGCGRDEPPEPQYLVVTATPDPDAEPAGGTPPADATPEPTAVPAPTSAPEPTDAPEPEQQTSGGKGGSVARPTDEPEPASTAGGGAVSSLADVKNAVVQIVAQGSFVDPEFGLQLNAAGSGSGFIVDPSGIAVTNNHVATGAAFLQVFMPGETRPRNAKILGVSECSDLAVIDIDGDGYPFLEWYTGAANPGLEVYTAGFPLGDPEYTLTRGIISKERADGDSNWASADHVIEHDARLNPGNSGGPLVTADGQVVGVNYAGIDSTGQYYAIGRQEFERVYETLRSGQDVTSIGVNGTVVQSADGAVSGIWVASVESGSPADQAGVKGGDIITQMEGLVLGVDGTMADYCDILRSHDATDTMSLGVLRWETGEFLEGQLNGRELKVAEVFFPETPGSEQQAGTPGGLEIEYMSVSDESGALVMDVPIAWDDINGYPWVEDDGTYVGAMVVAAPDHDGFMDSTDFPGVFFTASPLLAQEGYTPSDVLDEFPFWGDCSQQGERQEYDDGLYYGVWEEHKGCGADGKTIIYTIAAMPEEEDFVVWLGIQVRSEDEFQIAQQIADTFYVIGDLE